MGLTRTASFAAESHVEVIEKLHIGAASGWLERLVRPITSQADPSQFGTREICIFRECS